MNQPSIYTVPSFLSANLAPIRPLRQIADGAKQPNAYIQDAFKERYQHYMGLNRTAWTGIYNAMEVMSKFIAGEQLVVRNPFTGGMSALRVNREDESTKRALNLCQFYHTNVEKMWMGSSPDIEVQPGRYTDDAEIAAHGAAAVVDFYENKFYTPIFEQDQIGDAATGGTYIVCYGWDPGIQGFTAIREVIENKTQQFGPGAGYCGDCGTYGPAKDFVGDESEPVDNPEEEQAEQRKPPSMCPKCGSLSVIVEPPKSKQIQSVTGSEKYNLGNLTCKTWKLTGSRWDLNYRPEHSPWAIYQQNVNPGAIKALIGQIRSPGGENGLGDIGLEVQRRIANAGQAMGGRGTGSSNDKGYRQQWKVEEMYLSAEDLYDINVNEETQTISGQTLKAGRLSDQFRGGAVGVGLNGFNALIGLYPESHMDKIASGTYHKRPGSGAGRGAIDTVEVQKRINTLDSQQLMHVATTGTPGYMYRAGAFQADNLKYLGNPMVNIPVKDLPAGISLEDIARPMTPGTIAPAMVQYTQSWLKDNMQLAAHVTNFSDGLPGVDNNTATGAQLAATLAQSLFAPMLEVKAYTRARGAEIIVGLFVKHVPTKQYFPLAGKRNGLDGVYLAGSDLDIDLVYEAVSNSWMPKDAYTKRRDFESLSTAFGGAQNYIIAKVQSPKEVMEVERIYNITSNTESYDNVMTICRKRVKQMEAAVKMGAPTPMDIINAIQPVISPLEPVQPLKAEWFTDFLDTTDGQQAGPQMRAAVEGLIAIHTQHEAEKQAKLAEIAGMVQQAGQQPQMDAQHEQQMAQQEQQAQLQAAGQPGEQDPQQAAQMQSAQSAQDANQQAQLSAQDAANQQQSSEADHERQMEQMQAQQGHEQAVKHAEMGHKSIMQAADHAHKERIAEIAAKHAAKKAKAGAKKK